MLSSSQNNYPKIKGAVGANHNAEEQSDAVRNDLGGEEGARGSDCEQVVEETVSRKRKRKEVGSSSYNRSNEKVSKWVSSWYPQMNREEVEAACPFCRNNCNCKACMRQDERMQMKGEPVIVGNVLETGTELRWDPEVMWRAFRQVKSKKHDALYDVKTLDCLDWYEVDVHLHMFFNGYSQEEFHKMGWPLLLKLKDWPPSATFCECLP
ncbi:Lysine-specific demethylase JMJ25 [Linum perenne]